MNASSPAGSGEPAGLVGRRGLLRLAGAAGLATVVAACSAGRAPADDSAAPTQTSAAEIAPPITPSPARQPTVAPSLQKAVIPGQLCRDGWGAQPARPGGVPHTPARMTIHHTATALGDNSNIFERLRQHQRYHQDQLGWIDIAYHLGVDRHGNIYQMRDPQIKGDTATNYEPAGHFLVVVEGDFDQETVTAAQLDGAARAFAWSAATFGISPETLAGHRDVSHDTSCPGANLHTHVVSGELKRRIENHLATGPLDLPVICLPEAKGMVSAIQGGM